jgi:hypothetical protein
MFDSRQLAIPVVLGITVLSACSTATTHTPPDSTPAVTTVSTTTSTTAGTTSSTAPASADTGATTLPSTVPTTTPAPSPAPMPGMPMPTTNGDTAARSSVPSSTTAAATSTAATMPMGNMLMERQQLRLAVQSLNRARTELQRSTASYGGKKASAVQNIDGALRELRSAGGADSVNIAETTTEARVEGREIHLAIESLERARREMGSPTYMLGGHRASVLAAIDRALGDLRTAAEYEK